MIWLTGLSAHATLDWLKMALWMVLNAAWQIVVILILWIIVSFLGLILSVTPGVIYMICKKLDDKNAMPYWMDLATSLMILVSLVAAMVAAVVTAWVRLGVVGTIAVAGCMYIISRIIRK